MDGCKGVFLSLKVCFLHLHHSESSRNEKPSLGHLSAACCVGLKRLLVVPDLSLGLVSAPTFTVLLTVLLSVI